jgi:hypothetical protein
MRCKQCGQYIPEGTGIKQCSCGAGLQEDACPIEKENESITDGCNSRKKKKQTVRKKKQLSPEEKKKKRIASMGAVIGACSAMAVSALVMQNNYLSDRDLLKEVQNGNKLCPIMLDEYTRVDSFSMPGSKTFMQHTTAIGIVKEEANLDTIKKYIEPNLLENTRTNPQLKPARNSKVTFIYSFNDMNGEVFYEYTVTPKMYK